MEKVLNRGLNFAIMPLKLNLTQVLVYYKRFERSVIWHEFWFGKDKVEFEPPIFKKNKTNLPSKHPTPQGVKVFLSASGTWYFLNEYLIFLASVRYINES